MTKRWLGVLGRFTVEVDGKVRRLPPTTITVLIRLLVADGRLVTVDQLFRDIWPPGQRTVRREDRVSVQKRIAEIRKALDPERPGETSQILQTDRGGTSAYRLILPRDELDLYRFEDLVEQARASEPPQAIALFGEALRLWRDRPLLDAAALPFAHDKIRYLTALHDAVRRELTHAYREANQPAKARKLVESLLAERPGDAELEQIAAQLNVLEHGGGPVAAAQNPAPSGPTVPIPQELPPDIYGFTGRAREISELDALLAAGSGSAAVVISAVSGTAGVGKTALAVHWAHRVANRFPDGHLYIDLRGYDPLQPVPPTDALASLLRALGMDGRNIPLEQAERAARFRTLLAGRRTLLLLDNAHSAEQVRPMLPGSPSCFVLVTSRDSLAGLVARHGARRIELGLFSESEAATLLRSLIGARVDDDPAAANSLAQRCAHLPLVLSIAAELAAARPASSLSGLLGELADEQRRLDLFDAGADERTAVRAVFSWSYRQLPDDAARLFRFLGLHPGHDISAGAAAALIDDSVEVTQRLTDVLIRAHLVESSTPDRYRMHDLLRAYATERAADEDAGRRRSALTRLWDHYLSTAEAAMDSLFPAEQHRRSRVDMSKAGYAIAFSGPAQAKAWLEAERPNLVAMVGHAATRGWPSHATDLAATLSRYLDASAHYNDAFTIHRHALTAAGNESDRHSQARALKNIGTVYWQRGNNDDALDHYRQALRIFQETSDSAGEAEVLDNMGNVYRRWGRYAEALEHHERALRIQQQAGDRLGEAETLDNLGIAYRRWGRFTEALEHHQLALSVQRQLGNRDGEAKTLSNVGSVYALQERYADALEHHLQAFAIHQDLGNRAGNAIALGNLGIVYRLLGRFGESLDHLQRALEIHRQVGNRAWEVECLDGLGIVLRLVGQHEQALEQHRQALAINREMGNRAGNAIALGNLGIVYRLLGRFDESLDHMQRALEIHRQVGNRAWEVECLDELGTVLRLLGRHEQALEQHRQALSLAESMQSRRLQAMALNGLGEAYLSHEDFEASLASHREALALADEVNDRGQRERALLGISSAMAQPR